MRLEVDSPSQCHLGTKWNSFTLMRIEEAVFVCEGPSVYLLQIPDWHQDGSGRSVRSLVIELVGYFYYATAAGFS